ncbi:gibberellin 2-oxidase [Ramaria rubella]|nr:gibberellin 2-oxidase [Ramaria rubella]
MTACNIDIPPYTPPPPTKYTLDYAPLAVIDLSTFDRSPEDRTSLAHQLEDAVRNVGFWVVTGHDISDEEVNRQLSIAKAFFNLPLEDKREYAGDFANGSYLGYRERTRNIADTNVKENHEQLSVAKFDASGCRFPLHKFITPFASEIAAFQKKLWESVLKKLLVLIEILLELPEGHLISMHDYANPGDDYLSYRLYHHRTEEEWKEIEGKFRPGHTDFGSLSLVCNQTQTMSGLQIRTPQGEWKHVKPVPGGITVNAADTISMITNGYIKSTVHGVARPAPDQQGYDRQALLYFLRLNEDAEVVPVPSPVLKRLGYVKDEELLPRKNAVRGIGESATMLLQCSHELISSILEWSRARIKAYNYRDTIESVSEPAEFVYKELKAQVLYEKI